MKTLTALMLVLLLCSAEALFGQGTTRPGNTAAPDASGVLGFPREISYQGLLTTPSGTPAADGDYNLQFDVFNVPVGGLSLWSETQTGVSVVNGVFSVRLGSVAPLPDLFYQVAFLEVSALAGPGIVSTVTFSPRTQMTASAYSLAPWFTRGLDIYAGTFGSVLVGTDTADLVSKLLVKSHNRYAARFESDSLSGVTDAVHAVASGTGAADAVGVYGESVPQDWWGIGGEFVGGYHGVNGFAFPTGAQSYTGVSGGAYGGVGSNMGVYGNAIGGVTDYGVLGAAADSATNYAGYFSGRLRVSSVSGDSAAMFPADAVSAAEVLDEAGITTHSAYNSVAVTSTAASIDSVTITIPAGGYVIVDAGGLFRLNHVTGTSSNIWLNTGETADVTPGVPGFQWGYVANVEATGQYVSNFHSHRVFTKAAGTYTFYMNVDLNAGAGTYFTEYKWMQATYYPTSYGAVTAIALSASDELPGAAPSSVEGAAEAAPQLSTAREVDLRGLELEALRARAEADAAERQLLEAMLAKEREKAAIPDQR